MKFISIGKLSEEKKRNILIAVFIVLSVLICAYIFSNSFQSAEASKAKSGNVAKVVKAIVDPKNKIDKDVFHKTIRKIAHATEFMMLGLSLGGIFYNIYKKNGEKHISMPILLGMSVGLCDEFIQSFQKKRSSEVGDVLIDFSGAIIGLLAALLIAFLINFIKRKRRTDYVKRNE